MQNTTGPQTIKADFERLRADRTQRFEEAQQCARLTIPSLCTREWLPHNETVPPAYQSLGASLAEGMAATALSMAMPAQVPFFDYQVLPLFEKMAVETGNTELLERGKTLLFQRRTAVERLMESGPTRARDNRRAHSLRTRTLQFLLNMIVLPGACTRIDEDGNQTVFPFENWVCERDGCLDLLTIIVREKIDLLELTDAQLSRLPADMVAEYRQRHSGNRFVDIYRRAQWNPATDMWLVQDEVKDIIVAEREQKVCELFCDSDQIVPGQSLGNSIVQRNYYDLARYDQLSVGLAAHAKLASWAVLALDKHSNINADEVKQLHSLRVTSEFDVNGGQVTNAAVLSPSNVSSFQIAFQAMQDLEAKLRRQFHQLTGMVRDSERTTALEVARVTLAQAESSMGPLLATISEGYQMWLVRRYEVVAQNMKLLPELPEDLRKAFRISILTGAAALAKAQRAVTVSQFFDIVSRLPAADQFPEEINRRAVIDVLRQSMNIHEDIVLTPEQVAENRQQREDARVREQAAMAMGQAGANAVGGALETSLTSQTR
jgi:hypothetical protein